MPTAKNEKKQIQAPGSVYCPLCTHTVQATVTYGSRAPHVTPGQRCPRCSSSLDAGFVISVHQAA
jgi:hypothetical protein